MKGPEYIFKELLGLNFLGLLQFDEGKQKAKTFFKGEDGPFYNQ